MDLHFLQGWFPLDSSKHFPEQAKVCFPKVQACGPVSSLVLSSQDPEFHQFMAPAARAASSLHISKQFFLDGNIRYGRLCPFFGASIICVNELSSMHYRKLLHCSCCGVLPPRHERNTVNVG